MVLVSVLFGALQAAIFAFLGINIIRRTDLETPLLDKTLSGAGWTGLSSRVPDMVGPAAADMLVPLLPEREDKREPHKQRFQGHGDDRGRIPIWKQVLGSLNDCAFLHRPFRDVAVPAFIWLFTALPRPRQARTALGRHRRRVPARVRIHTA